MTTKPSCIAMPFTGNLYDHYIYRAAFNGSDTREVIAYYRGALGLLGGDGDARVVQACKEYYQKFVKAIGDTPVMVCICDYQHEEWEKFKKDVPLKVIYQSAKTWNGNYPEEKEPYITVYIFQFIQE